MTYTKRYDDPTTMGTIAGMSVRGDLPDIAIIESFAIGNGSWSAEAPIVVPMLAKRTIVKVAYTGDEYDDTYDTAMYLALPECPAGTIFEFVKSGAAPLVLYSVPSGGELNVIGTNVLEHATSVLRLEKLEDPYVSDPPDPAATYWLGTQSMPRNDHLLTA